MVNSCWKEAKGNSFETKISTTCQLFQFFTYILANFLIIFQLLSSHFLCLWLESSQRGQVRDEDGCDGPLSGDLSAPYAQNGQKSIYKIALFRVNGAKICFIWTWINGKYQTIQRYDNQETKYISVFYRLHNVEIRAFKIGEHAKISSIHL